MENVSQLRETDPSLHRAMYPMRAMSGGRTRLLGSTTESSSVVPLVVTAAVLTVERRRHCHPGSWLFPASRRKGPWGEPSPLQRHSPRAIHHGPGFAKSLLVTPSCQSPGCGAWRLCRLCVRSCGHAERHGHGRHRARRPWRRARARCGGGRAERLRPAREHGVGVLDQLIEFFAAFADALAAGGGVLREHHGETLVAQAA